MIIKNLKKNLLFTEDNLLLAINKLQTNQIKTILVINKKKQLVGTITDGDVRRALLKGANKETKISYILNPKPKVFSIQSKLNKNKVDEESELIPFINKKRIIKYAIYNKKKFENKEKKNNVDVVIMAGGPGKRLMPYTLDTPKPLIKIHKKPIIEYIINNLAKHEFKNIYVSLFYKSEKIKKFFKKKRYQFQINFLEEKTPLGTAGSLSLLDYKSLQDNIIIHNGDVITNLNFKNLLEFHNDLDSDITVCAKEYTDVSPFGKIYHNLHKINKIVEKPKSTNFFNAGIYVIKKKIIKDLPLKYLDMTSLIEKKILSELNVNIYPIYEYWVDVGRKEILKELFKNKDKVFKN